MLEILGHKPIGVHVKSHADLAILGAPYPIYSRIVVVVPSMFKTTYEFMDLDYFRQTKKFKHSWNTKCGMQLAKET